MISSAPSYYSYSTGAPSPAVYNGSLLGINPLLGAGLCGGFGYTPFGFGGLGAPLLGGIAGVAGYGMPFGGVDANVFTPF